MVRTYVVNIRDVKPTNSNDVYIGRGSKWGNPFSHLPSRHTVTHVGSRAEALRRYSLWIHERPELMNAISELIGKRLVCHCKPFPCHGDILAALANELLEERAGAEE